VPLLFRLGEDWRRGEMGIHHEHMASSIVRALLDSLREANGAGFGGPAIVVSTPPGETHELGALMAAVIAAAEGCRVTYLGPNLPLEEIAAAARAVRARAVALSFVHGERDPTLAESLARFRERLDAETEIFVGGAAARRYADVLRRIGANAPETLDRFRTEVARLANWTE
jgi:Predicted cobalamin binding protein